MGTKTDNLWSSLLRETSKKPKALHLSCCILGDCIASKKKIIDVLCPNSSVELFGQTSDLVESYGYIDNDESLESETGTANVWSFNEAYFDSAKELQFENNSNQRVRAIEYYL